MKTTQLTWEQARNLLHTGMCEVIGYHRYSNWFKCINGVIYKSAGGGHSYYKDLPRATNAAFKVIK